MQPTIRRRLLASTLLIGASTLASAAYAQDTSTQAPGVTTQDAVLQEAAQQGDQEIVVTGSLISNPNLEQSSPVNVTTSDEIELKQSNVAEEVLRELPGVVPSIGSAVNNGNGGASYVDLRGLGSNRNIVLLDGVRIAPSGLVGRVDLNNIPLALVERVDALTGAAVTTYGADAITGVVNFITKKDFSGVELQASEQITEQGDGNVFRLDATLGSNFDDGRGNAVFSIGYQQADAVYQGARDFSIEQVDSYTGLGGGSGTSVPSRFTGTRPIDPATGLPSVDPTVGNGGTRQIDPTTGTAVGTFALFNFNPFNVFQTPFERFNIFGQARYEISDAVEVYTRGLFSKNLVSTIIAPSGSFGGSVPINLNNPFLPTALRQQFCAFDVNPSDDVYTPRFTPAECDAAALATGSGDPAYRVTGTNGFVVFDVDGDGDIDVDPDTGEQVEGYNPNPAIALSRRTPEVGPRISDYQTTIFDYRAGLRGALTDSIDWDIAGSYGESENIQTIKGYTLQSRFRQGTLANGTAANPVCEDTSNGCVPINIFGPEGSITPAMADFLNEQSTTINRTSLAQVRGVVSGDFGTALPWAAEPIGFAVGGEYRKYRASQSSDTLAKQAGELGGAGGAAPDIDGGYDVYEGFAELIAPIVEDRPFFESLTLEAGIRYSHYKVDAPGTPTNNATTYKVGGNWEPGAGIKFRGSYSHAVRAPNIFELFNPLSTVLTNLGIDPCSGDAPVNDANLRATCISQGAPVGTIGNILNPTAAQANITTGGNVNLKPEKADTYTVGVVFQPEFVPGFTASVDYYNIKVKDVIGAPLPGDLIGACFDAPSPTNPDCAVIRRNPLTGGLDGDPSTTPGLFAPLSNLGELFTDGIDLVANYRTDMLGFADLALSFVGNWTHSSKFKATPDGLNRECVGFYSVNCSFTGSIQPEFQFSQRTTLSFADNVDVSLLWRFIDSVSLEPAQFDSDLAAAIDADCADPQGADPDGCVINPEFRTIPSEHYFDLTTRFGVTDNLTFTLTVQNLLDNKPKVVGNTIGSTTFNSGNIFPSTYDSLGRRFAVSAKLRF